MFCQFVLISQLNDYLVSVWESTVAILGAGYLFWEFIRSNVKKAHIYASMFCVEILREKFDINIYH